MRLKDKVAIITASGSGMGKATALLFAREGARVCVADINEEQGQKTEREIERKNGHAIFLKTDVSKIEDIRNMIDVVVKEYGKLDILFNHAGIPGPGSIEDVTEESFNQIIEVNLKSCLFATQYAINQLKKQGHGGSIIFTSSTSGISGSPHSPIYSMTKGGLIPFAKSLAKAFAPYNIRVNCIAPGLMDTPMAKQFLKRTEEDNFEKNKKMVVDRIPMGRMGKPEEVAMAALYLASDESSFTTGTVIPVDGGYLA
jgi:NAD(P)-dependent dehydrogenase (short-subunit alcohol dehydrogenase family)